MHNRAAVLVALTTFLVGAVIDADALDPKTCGFTLVDSEASNTSYELADFANNISIDYSTLKRATLNIRVNTDGCPASTVATVDSVLIEWDRNVSKMSTNLGSFSNCEKFTPYSVFGSSQKGKVSTWKDLGNYGDFNDAILPLGVHNLRATPFSSPDCTGTPLSDPLVSQVMVHIDGNMSCPGDVAFLEVWNKTSKMFLSSIVNGAQVEFPKGSVLKVAAPACFDNGGIVKWVTIKIYSIIPRVCPNELVSVFNTTKTSDYFTALSPSNLPPGIYIVEATPYGNYFDNGKLVHYAEGPTTVLIISVVKVSTK